MVLPAAPPGASAADLTLESISECGPSRDVIMCDPWHGGHIWVCFWNCPGGSERGEGSRGSDTERQGKRMEGELGDKETRARETGRVGEGRRGKRMEKKRKHEKR